MRPSAEQRPVSTTETDEVQVSKRTVLLVDDAPYLLDLASLFLARTARIEKALGGRAGLEAARRLQPDLIVTDDCMPELDGLELCRTIRDDPLISKTPVLMLLSNPSGEAHGAAIRAGANDVLPKPLERVSLVTSVARFLSRGTVRGLPRVDANVPVSITTPSGETGGRLRKLSRGGVFVETDAPLVCADEVGLRFQLPESSITLRASAEVVWARNSWVSKPDGVGLRFVEIDSTSCRAIDDFVYEHLPELYGATR